MAAGHRPREVLNWPEHERAVAVNAVMKLEAWRLEQLAEMWGAK